MRVLAAALALLFSHTATASLSWEYTTSHPTALPTDLKVEVAFPFVNTGSETVTIDSVHSSCGCTTTELAKTEYKPGESGSIKAIFTFGDRVGAQHKTITVIESEGDKPTTVLLELFVDIPETVGIEPRVQFWKQNDAPAARPIVIRIAQGFPGTPYGAHMYSEHSNFTLGAVEKVGEGVYRISVTPQSTSEIVNEAGEILVSVKGQEPRRILFYTSIRP